MIMMLLLDGVTGRLMPQSGLVAGQGLILLRVHLQLIVAGVELQEAIGSQELGLLQLLRPVMCPYRPQGLTCRPVRMLH